MSLIFSEMIKPENIGEVSRADLRALSMIQLEAFAKLLGIPFSGDRAKRVERIFDALSVRHFLTASDEPNFYISKYSRRELVRYTKLADSFVGSTKYGLAVGLLNWRTKCRRDGEKFFEEMRTEIRKRPKQFKLF